MWPENINFNILKRFQSLRIFGGFFYTLIAIIGLIGDFTFTYSELYEPPIGYIHPIQSGFHSVFLQGENAVSIFRQEIQSIQSDEIHIEKTSGYCRLFRSCLCSS